MKSWALLLLLAATHIAADWLGPIRWYAFTAMLGLLSAVLLWQIRGKRWSMIWLVCLWGMVEGSQVFVCQILAGLRKLHSGPFSGSCETITSLPLYTAGLMAAAALAALWLDRNKR